MRYYTLRLYIPISDDDEYLCLEADKPARIVRGEPDPFSRVACPFQSLTGRLKTISTLLSLTACASFQSLTGRLKTLSLLFDSNYLIMFQSLTGRLKTVSHSRSASRRCAFQSLTGRLKTRLQQQTRSDASRVSIPHR